MSRNRSVAVVVGALVSATCVAPLVGPAAVRAGVPAVLPGGLCAYTPDVTGNPNGTFVGMPSPVADTAGSPVATLETNLGTITLALDAAAAPCAVNSFRFLIEQGYYEGSECHRMLNSRKAGVLQCGDPTGSGSGSPGYEFGDENLAGATYPRGVLAMANRGPDTNGGQFFLVFRDSGFAPDYTPFGTVSSGLEVLDSAAEAGTFGPRNDRPRTEVVLERVTISG